MKLTIKSFFVLLLTLVISHSEMTAQNGDGYLYKCVTIRAAPGQLLPLIDHLKSDLKKIKDSGEEPAYMFRHHQGDQWDIFLMVPVGDYATYFGSKTAKILERTYGDKYYDNVALQEEGFVRGPDLKLFRDTWQNNTFFHSEMLLSLGGKQKDLYKEREMENVYSLAKGSVYNMIFTRENGFGWDIFTLGGYRDYKHYAEIQMSDADSEAAAKKAGFKSSSDIGPYLRSLINFHHDTLGGKIDY